VSFDAVALASEQLILNGINTPIFSITPAINFPSATMQKLITYRSK
jgi:hypothetical protein